MPGDALKPTKENLLTPPPQTGFSRGLNSRGRHGNALTYPRWGGWLPGRRDSDVQEHQQNLYLQDSGPPALSRPPSDPCGRSEPVVRVIVAVVTTDRVPVRDVTAAFFKPVAVLLSRPIRFVSLHVLIIVGSDDGAAPVAAGAGCRGQRVRRSARNPPELMRNVTRPSQGREASDDVTPRPRLLSGVSFLPALRGPTSSAAPFGSARVRIPVCTSSFLEMYLYICTPADLHATP